MPERDQEVFSNPLPPQRLMSMEEEDDSHPLTNDDFRKMLMTPRGPVPGGSAQMHGAPPIHKIGKVLPDDFEEEEGDDPATRRRKKKMYYAKLKKLEEDKKKELASKYRDRANERREGKSDYAEQEVMSTTADYRAVAPDAKAGENYAERRKQLIQESKYLGGDMEHTHLVKGLDYALLEKVRAEITSKEEEDEFLEEMLHDNNKKEVEEEPKETVELHGKLAKSIYRTLFKKRQPERNELFAPGRMAYAVELEEEYAESDIPTTLIRSKADCPSLESTTTLTTNDIVINKLTQILSYLRQGRRDKKKKLKEKGKHKEEEKKPERLPGHEVSIYDDIADYTPSFSKSKDRKDKERRDRDRGDRDRDRDRGRDRGRDRDRDRDRDRRDRDKKRSSYFEKPAEEDDEKERKPSSAKELVKSINEKFAKGWAPADLEREAGFAKNMSQDEKERGMATVFKKDDDPRQKKIKKKVEIDSYAECYPGMMESADAIDDSDDEVDYTKMDMGNKKGPVGRWDFDTQEEYSTYMSNKEALPKAAFQYGVKMADGRKTRRAGPKDEKAQLDREWQQIQNLIQKRKRMGTEGDPYGKKPKY